MGFPSRCDFCGTSICAGTYRSLVIISRLDRGFSVCPGWWMDGSGTVVRAQCGRCHWHWFVASRKNMASSFYGFQGVFSLVHRGMELFRPITQNLPDPQHSSDLLSCCLFPVLITSSLTSACTTYHGLCMHIFIEMYLFRQPQQGIIWGSPLCSEHFTMQHIARYIAQSIYILTFRLFGATLWGWHGFEPEDTELLYVRQQRLHNWHRFDFVFQRKQIFLFHCLPVFVHNSFTIWFANQLNLATSHRWVLLDCGRKLSRCSKSNIIKYVIIFTERAHSR